jgi:hypothetical protein
MAFAQGKFGIEYNPVRTDEDSPALMLWTLGVVFLVALVSLVVTISSRKSKEAKDAAMISAEISASVAEERRSNAEETANEQPAPEEPVAEAPPEPEVPPPEKIAVAGTAKRPAKVTNLLMRLEEAEKRHDIAMTIETIEQLRSLPGNPAADLDDPLARRLGVLNMRRLFGPDKSPWTAEVVVKRGDNASRIAYEHGSTLASFAKLNGGNVDKVVIGKKMRVMEHPRFSLVIHRLTKTADLSLNGKFFKRYYLNSEVKGEIGAYEKPERIRPFWAEKGISLDAEDRAELEMLLPRGATIIIAEL